MATFTLTGAEDRLRGTSDGDTFTGGAGTLSRADRILGGGGDDVLTAGLANNLSGAEAPRISFVETLFIDAQGGDLSLRNIRGADRIIADQTSLVLEDAGLNVEFGARGVESGTVTIAFRADLSGSSDTLRLSSEDANVTFKAQNDPQNNAIEFIELAATGTTRDREQVDISAFTSLQALTLTGGNDIKITADSSAFSRLDASEATGDVELTSFNSTDQDLDLTGGSGDDSLSSGTGDDRLIGNDGNDSLNGEAGQDTLDGGAGNDTLRGNAGADSISGGEGNDFIRGSGGRDTIEGGDGNDNIGGGNGADMIVGGAGDDFLRGGNDADTIEAGSGDNVLIGGAGADLFVFADGTDRVRDFIAGTDTLEFSDGTELSTRQDIIDLRDARPDALAEVESDRIVFEIGGATTTVLIDTDFLN